MALARSSVAAKRRGLGPGDRHMTADHDFLGRMAGGFNDLKRAAVDRGMAERARYGGMALLGDGIDAGATDVDRVMTGDAMLGDRAALTKGEGIVAAADDDLAYAGDVNLVMTVAGDNRTVTKNGYIRLPTARDANETAHWISPRIRRLNAEIVNYFARPENSYLTTANIYWRHCGEVIAK